MQNDGRQQSFLPDRSMTYSTASSFYNRESSYDFAAPAPAPAAAPAVAKYNIPSVQFPSPEILLGNYSRGAADRNGTSPPAKKRRKPSLNDPIQTHLLLQTALGDSGTFEILSLDELEGLKREITSLRTRVTGLQKRLALETKVRDAAKSLVRLHSGPSSATSSPRLNRRSSNLAKESQDRARAELAEAEQKCDSLARELYNLEQRERQVQTRILQHTAGILQNTHHGFSKNQGLPFVPGGRPDSPASLDGSQSRALTGEIQGYDELMFTDASAFDTMLEGLGTTQHKRQPSSRIMSRETAVQQREMMVYLANGLEDLNKRIAAVLGKTNARKAQQYRQFPDMVDEAVNISFAQRLDRLTQGLDDIEQEQTTLQQEAQKRPPPGNDQQIAQLQAELQASLQENLALQQEHDKIEDSMTSQLADINSELYQLLSTSSPNMAKAPPESGPMDSLEYIKAQVVNIRNLVQSSSATVNQSRQVDAVLQGLWSFIIGAEDDLRQRKRAEREQLAAKRSAGAQINSEDEVSEDEEDDLGQEFTLQAFNTKIQWLVSQSLFLKEKQGSLRRKVKAHRERADRSLESVAGNDGLRDQLDKANELYATAQEELRGLEVRAAQLQKSQDEKDARVKALQDEIAKAEADTRNFETRAIEMQQSQDEKDARVKALQEQIVKAEADARSLEMRTAQLQQSQDEKDARVKALQEQILKAETDARNEARSEAKVEIEVLEQQLRDTQQKAITFEKDLAAARKEREADTTARSIGTEEASKNEAELTELRDEVVRLKTELTIAQAELDGAYGSRSQRAKETAAAANTEASLKLDTISVRNAELEAQLMELQKGGGNKEAQLRKELAETLKEFEELTKASVDSEREREELEGAIDKYRDRVEVLEAQIAEDQVKWLGMIGDAGNASPGSASSGPPSQSMSVVVLKNEFKKMMREARVESAKQLRAEQDERRRLESIVRNLKKGSGPGKSSLTYTLTA